MYKYSIICTDLKFVKENPVNENCVGSILNQTYKDFQIVVPMGNTDKEWEYPEKVKVYTTKAKSFHTIMKSALRKVEGDAVIFLNHNVVLPENYLEMLDLHFHPYEKPICYSSYTSDYGDNENQIVSREYNKAQLWRSCYIPMSTMIIAKNVLDEMRFNKDFDYLYWWNFVADIALNWEFTFIPDLYVTFSEPDDDKNPYEVPPDKVIRRNEVLTIRRTHQELKI